MLFIFLLQKDFQIIWLSNHLILSVPDKGYSRNVLLDIIVFIHNFFYHEHVKFWTAIHLRFNNFLFHVWSYIFLIYCVTLEQLHWIKSNLYYYNIRVIIFIDVFIIRVIYYRIHNSIGKGKKKAGKLIDWIMSKSLNRYILHIQVEMTKRNKNVDKFSRTKWDAIPFNNISLA